MFITFSFFFCPCVIFLVVPSSVQMFGTSISAFCRVWWITFVFFFPLVTWDTDIWFVRLFSEAAAESKWNREIVWVLFLLWFLWWASGERQKKRTHLGEAVGFPQAAGSSKLFVRHLQMKLGSVAHRAAAAAAACFSALSLGITLFFFFPALMWWTDCCYGPWCWCFWRELEVHNNIEEK